MHFMDRSLVRALKHWLDIHANWYALLRQAFYYCGHPLF